MKTAVLVLGVAALACWACSRAPESPAKQQPPKDPIAQPTERHTIPIDSPAKPSPPPAIEVNSENGWHDELLTIAGQYTKYAKIADDPGWAPTMCTGPYPDSALLSRADKADDHGRKLYFLWVSDRNAYPPTWFPDEELSQIRLQPIGQTLVKESFVPGEGANPADATAPRTLGTRSGLFVMFKTDPKTPNTDNGWVYGTLSADGKTVTSSGKIESCMGCHEGAKHDRMFGLPQSAGTARAKPWKTAAGHD